MATERPVQPAATNAATYPAEGYAWYVVIVLMIVYIFSFVDRQILALLVGPIQRDLNIGDTYMGFLHGTSFAIFYTVFGIPMGRIADSRSRRGLIAFGLAAWSLMSAGCGIAKTYGHLLAFRIGVGVGEATLSPAAYSLITDYFRPQRIALALSAYGAGIYIGSGLAFILGGAVVEYASTRGPMDIAIIGTVQPWQFVFFAIGLPGLIFTVALLTVKEPVRRSFAAAAVTHKAVPLRDVAHYVWTNWQTFLCHNVGFALLSFIGYGAAAWVPSFYVRVHGWAPGETGMRYGLAVVIFGTAGILFGGWFAQWLAARGHSDSKMRSALWAAVLHLPFGLAFPLVPNEWLAYGLMLPATFFLAMPFGVGPAAIQEMMPNRMRGQASALYLFVVNLIGIGLGPLLVGMITEFVFQDMNKVGWSLVIVGTAAGLLSAALLLLGLSRFRRSLDHLKHWETVNAAPGAAG